jgi:hypothetical protein
MDRATGFPIAPPIEPMLAKIGDRLPDYDPLEVTTAFELAKVFGAGQRKR